MVSTVYYEMYRIVKNVRMVKERIFLLTATNMWANSKMESDTDRELVYTLVVTNIQVNSRMEILMDMGTYTYANGVKYTGEFKYGFTNGKGVEIYPDGRRQEGYWTMGEYVGEKEPPSPTQ